MCGYVSVRECVYVCVCVRERERDIERVCERDSVCVRERPSANFFRDAASRPPCVFACVCERVCVCMCVCERERARERESVCV